MNQTVTQVQQQQGWVKGTLYYGVNQTKGTAGTTKYNIDYRIGSGAWNRLWTNGYTSKNNTFYGAYHAHSTTGTSKYGYKLTKVTNLGTASTLQVHFGVK